MSQTQTAVVTLFLASPSDVNAERQAVRRVVEEMNGTLGAELGYFVRIHAWEDQSPGAGRPQDLINPGVDACDIFLGLLWKWWGQPTGSASSGFREEFDRAVGRRRRSGFPEIWLALRDIDADSRADPGPQLQQVIAFREEQRGAGELLYQSFQDEVDLSAKVRAWLTRYLVRTSRGSEPLRNDGAAPLHPTGTVPDERPAETHGALLPTDLRQASARIAEAIANPADGIGSVLRTTYADFSRMRLFSTSVLNLLYGEEGLSTHEVNRLYTLRWKLILTVIELRALLRALLSSGNDVTPGWFWCREERDGVTFLIDELSHLDYASAIGALELLTDARAQLQGASLDAIIKRSAEDQSGAFARALLRHIAQHSSDDALPLLNRVEFDGRPDLRADVNHARRTLLLKRDPGRVLEGAGAAALSDDPGIVVLIRKGEGFPPSLLKNLTADGPRTIRQAAILATLDRELADEPLLRSLTGDKDIEIRQLAYDGLVRIGVRLEPQEIRAGLEPEGKNLGSLLRRVDADPTILSTLLTREPVDLESLIRWSGIDAPLAYRAQGQLAFGEYGDRIRHDLDDEFKSFRVEGIRRRYAALGIDAELTEDADAGLTPEIDAWILARFTATALLVLAEKGSPADARYGRHYIDSKDHGVRDAAALLLGRVGDSGDAETLLAVAGNQYGAEQVATARQTWRLGSGTTGIGPRMLKSDHQGIVLAALRGLAEESFSSKYALIKPLLRGSVEAVRMAAVASLCLNADPSALEAILDKERDGIYYYDVGTWLDRLVYAPEPFRTLFQRQLQEKLPGAYP